MGRIKKSLEENFVEKVKSEVPKMDVEKFYYVIRDEWLKNVNMSLCINCGKRDYHAHELVKIKGHDNMGLVCFDCLVKNNYWRTYNRIKKTWIWEKFEKKEV